MKEKIKQKWVEALKSKKYKQSQDALRTPQGFCCLGVLCDLYIEAKKLKGWRKVDRSHFSFGPNVTLSGYLPDTVMKWAGLPSNDPKIIQGRHQDPISVLNDRGITFKELAKLIEEQL